MLPAAAALAGPLVKARTTRNPAITINVQHSTKPATAT